FPLTSVFFGKFTSKGYIFSKAVGLAIAGYMTWLLASIKILPFSLWAVYLVLAAFLAANIFLSKKNKAYQAFITDSEFRKRAVAQEALFIILLAFWAFLRGLKPDIIGEEKFMDFGFLKSILRSEYFPPLDMWYARMPINYYYLGQYYAAYLTKISGVDSVISYNLMMATLFALSFMEAHSIGQFLFQIYRQNLQNASPGSWRPYQHAETICGLLSGALICLGGNLHTFIYAWMAKDPERAYWFPDATRYIGYNPVVETDGTIHEFPLYSFVVSDLHAHVINMLFVLTVIGAAIAVAMEIMTRVRTPAGAAPKMVEAKDAESAPSSTLYGTLVKICPRPGFFLILFLIGLFPATNFWDFPIYIVVTGAIYLYANLKRGQYSLKSIGITILQVLLTALVSYVVMLPFQMNFEVISAKIAFVTIRSRFYQLFVLYGYQIIFFAMLLAEAVILSRKPDAKGTVGVGKKAKGNKKSGLVESGAFYVPAQDTGKHGLIGFLEKLNPADGIALILFICAIGLIILPELIYVVDIYPNNPRANTMFKLCYQAFIMLGLSVGYTYPRLYLNKEKSISFPHIAALFLLFCAFIYPFYSIRGWYGSLHFSAYKGLNGIQYMRTHEEKLDEAEDAPMVRILEDDYEIIEYIRQNVRGQPTIAEANDLSYTAYGRVAAATGLPDIFNWYTHQQLWRNSQTDLFQERIDDISALYTSDDPKAIQQVLRKYDVQYIVVGKLERHKFEGRLNEEMLRSLGTVVFQKNESLLIEVAG
ncbi:MAG: DUF2298 domain-containing protein, partial [Clostridiales bacterium]|nr:DUF2298 domain-containing protein [Clostridiales bacterium]